MLSSATCNHVCHCQQWHSSTHVQPLSSLRTAAVRQANICNSPLSLGSTAAGEARRVSQHCKVVSSECPAIPQHSHIQPMNRQLYHCFVYWRLDKQLGEAWLCETRVTVTVGAQPGRAVLCCSASPLQQSCTCLPAAVASASELCSLAYLIKRFT